MVNKERLDMRKRKEKKRKITNEEEGKYTVKGGDREERGRERVRRE